jgi:hypothetical protein
MHHAYKTLKNAFFFRKETKEFLRLAKDVQVSIEIHPLKKLASLALPLIGKPLPFRSNEQLELKQAVER